MRFSAEDRKLIEQLAQQHQVSEGAVETLWLALERGQGTMAQFDHPELGGMGQWMASGMIMIGDFTNHRLKAKVDQLCHELVEQRRASPGSRSAFATFSNMNASWSAPSSWWPPALGTPTASGGQNTLHYAYFAQLQRLAIRLDKQVRIYDTQGHQIQGVSQQQDQQQKLVFQSQKGTLALDRLPKLEEYQV